MIWPWTRRAVIDDRTQEIINESIAARSELRGIVRDAQRKMDIVDRQIKTLEKGASHGPKRRQRPSTN